MLAMIQTGGPDTQLDWDFFLYVPLFKDCKCAVSIRTFRSSYDNLLSQISEQCEPLTLPGTINMNGIAAVRNHRRLDTLVFSLSVLSVWLICQPLSAGDWPQILGPNRTGKAASDEKLASNWGDDGPRVAWQREVGEGYSGIIVEKDRAILFHRADNEEVIECLDAATGEPHWKNSYPTTFHAQVGGMNGPLATPAMAEGNVITFGAQGVLSCHNLASGKRLWQRDTHKDFGAREGYFGAGSSPLVADGRVFVNVGGFQSGASIVAFSLKDGSTLWQSVDDHASYSSPVLREVDGVDHLIFVTRFNCVSSDPKTGEQRFLFPFGQRGPTVNAAVPIVKNKQLFLSASYGIGAVLANIKKDGADEVWAADNLYSTQYCTPIEVDGHYFGIDGRYDVPPAELKCFDPVTQTTLWSIPNVEYGALIYADDKLLMLSTEGRLTLFAANAKKFERLASATVLKGTCRALPALSGGRLYVRDDATLRCLQVGTK